MTRQEAIKQRLWLPCHMSDNPYIRQIKDQRLGITLEGTLCTFEAFIGCHEWMKKVNRIQYA